MRRKLLLIFLLLVSVSACPMTNNNSFSEVEKAADGSEIYTTGIFDGNAPCLNFQSGYVFKIGTICQIPLAENGGTNAKSLTVSLTTCSKENQRVCIEPITENNTPPEAIKIHDSSGTVIVPFSTVRVKLEIRYHPENIRGYYVTGIN